MRILLAAVNAKFIHTNPAVYSLRAFARENLAECVDVIFDVSEFTINDRYQDVLAGIIECDADIIAFSVYIWNVERIRHLIRDIRKIRGSLVKIWAGGPEASWFPQPLLKDGADLCMTGEGEVVFTELVKLECSAGGILDSNFSEDRYEKLPGLAFMRGDKLVKTGIAQIPSIDRIPFLYDDIASFEDRIIYYEASRGCPFSCAYCLSGKERGVRYRNPETVERELQFFLDQRVRQVKFVDRSFNADPVFALRIWRYISGHDNGVTNFHFEIEGDRLTDEELELLGTLRPGLIQMEIGVQSANPETLRSVHRNPSLAKIRSAVGKLVPRQNINVHLDLIAGLPYENLESFRSSFNTVYAMRPHQLQLGFLKLLKGTELYERRDEYGLVCSDDPPYEVLKTKWLTFDDLELLHRINDRVEEFVNSGCFRRSLQAAETLFADPFELFTELDIWYNNHGFHKNRPSAQKRYEIFIDFIEERAEREGLAAEKKKQIRELIRLDRALHTHPSRRMISTETFEFAYGTVILNIDHTDCSPVNGEASFEEASGKSDAPEAEVRMIR